MSYESIDAIISEWATKHALHLCTSYRDEEVRSVDVHGPGVRKCQIWVDPPDENAAVAVHVWDYEKRREDNKVARADLVGALEEAYAIAMKWSH